MKPLGKTKREWSPEVAYAVGLIAADGNLSKDRRHLAFTSGDKDLIKTFCRCLEISPKIIKKKSGYTGRFDHFQIQFSDVLFYRWLEEVGFMPNKSKILGEIKVPRELFFDFFRGCYDGDGSMYAYWDPRWHSSYMYYLAIASASENFLEWLEHNINELVGIKGKFSRAKGRGATQLRYAKAGTRVLFNKMYYSKDVPCLRRKLVKAEKIFRIDETHNCAK